MSTKELQNLLTAFAVEKSLTPTTFRALHAAYVAKAATLLGRSLSGGGKEAPLPIRSLVALVKASYVENVEPTLWMSKLDSRLYEWILSLDTDLDGYVSWRSFFDALCESSLRRRFHPTYSDNMETCRWSAGSTSNCIWVDPWKRLAVATEEGVDVKLYSLNGTPDSVALRGHSASIMAMYYIASLDKIVTTACDRLIIVWDHRRGVPMQRGVMDEPATCVHYDESLEKLIFTPLSGHLVPVPLQAIPVISAADDHLAVDEAERSVNKHADWITVLTSSARMRLIASGSRDRSIILWTTVGLEVSRRLVGHTRAVSRIEFVEEDGLVVSTEIGGSNTLVWNPRAASSACIHRLAHDSEVVGMFVDRFSGGVICLEASSKLSVWSLTPLSLITEVEPTDATKPRSMLRGAALLPGSRGVVGAYTTHIAEFRTKPYGTRTPRFGDRVVSLHIDESTFNVIVVTKWILFVLRGTDGETICAIEYPFGKQQAIQHVFVLQGVVFCTAGTYAGLLKLAECRKKTALRRVVGVTDNIPIVSVSRTPIEHVWVIALQDGSVVAGRLKVDDLEYRFERTAFLSTPSWKQLLSGGAAIDMTESDDEPWYKPVVTLSRFAFVDEKERNVSAGGAFKEFAVGIIVFHPPANAPDACLAVSVNTRSITRTFHRVDGRGVAHDAVFLADRHLIVILHAGSGCLCAYTCDMIKVIEISHLTAVLGGLPTTMSWIGADRLAMCTAATHQGFGVVNMAEAINTLIDGVGATTTQSNSPPSPTAGAQSPSTQRSREAEKSLIVIGATSTALIPTVTHRGFAAITATGFDLMSHDERLIKIHRFLEGHEYEVRIRARFAGTPVEPWLLRMVEAWSQSNADVVARNMELSNKSLVDMREEWMFRISDSVIRGTNRTAWYASLLAKPERCLIMERGNVTLIDAIREKMLSWGDKERVIEDLVSSALELARLGFVHSEIHPRHIARQHGVWKLCGCDSIVEIDSELIRPRDGFDYLPAEVATVAFGERYRATPAICVWAVGCVAFELATGRRLFRGRTAQDIQDAVAASSDTLLGLQMNQFPTSSKMLQAVVTGCIARDIKRRITLDALHDMTTSLKVTLGKTTSRLQSSTTNMSANSPTTAHNQVSANAQPVPASLPHNVEVVEATAATLLQTVSSNDFSSVKCVGGDPSSGLVVVSDVDLSASSQGYIHLCSLSDGTLCYHGRTPQLEVGMVDANGEWNAPLQLLSTVARRGLVANLASAATKASAFDRDETTLADALATVVPVINNAGPEDGLLREWERLSVTQVTSMVEQANPARDRTELQDMQEFKEKVEKRTQFYSDTGGKRKAGESIELYAAQPKLRMSELQMAKVQALQADVEIRRRRERVAKIVAPGQNLGDKPRLHQLSEEFLRSIPTLSQESKRSLSTDGVPLSTLDEEALLRSVASLDVNRHGDDPVRNDPNLITSAKARTTFNLHASQNAKFEEELVDELQKRSESPLRRRAMPKYRVVLPSKLKPRD